MTAKPESKSKSNLMRKKDKQINIKSSHFIQLAFDQILYTVRTQEYQIGFSAELTHNKANSGGKTTGFRTIFSFFTVKVADPDWKFWKVNSIP